MAAPTLEQTRSAATNLFALQDADFDRRKTAEAGDNLIAFFGILSRKLFPNDSDIQQGQRVEVMLGAYFLRGDIEQLKVTPPDEARAKKVVQAVGALTGKQLDQRMSAEIGEAVLAFFSGFAKKVTGAADAKTVQLMVLAYLVRQDLLAA